MKLFIIFLFCLSLFSSDYEEHSARHINKELSHLNLSAKQSKKIRSILKEFREELREYRTLKKEIEEHRKDLFLKERLDIEKLNALNQKLDAKAHEIENELLEKIHAILNLKQRIKFIDHFDDWEVE